MPIKLEPKELTQLRKQLPQGAIAKLAKNNDLSTKQISRILHGAADYHGILLEAHELALKEIIKKKRAADKISVASKNLRKALAA